MAVLALRSGRRRGLGADARADRVPAGRGPRLSDRQRATARRRLEGAHRRGHATESRGSPGKLPGVEHVVTVSGVSVLDNMASLANAGVAFVVLKDWDVRLKQKGQDLRSIYQHLEPRPARRAAGRRVRAPAAADPGHRQRQRLHHAGRDQERRFRLCAAAEPGRHRDQERQLPIGSAAGWARRSGPVPRSSTSSSTASRPRRSASRSATSFPRLADYVGSNYAAQFNKFGHVFQVYTQALPDYRASVNDIKNLRVKAGNGKMTPIGTVIDVKRGPRSAADQPLQSLSVGDGHRRRGPRI